MSSSSETENGSSTTSCRRNGARKPLPVEVNIVVADRMISGIVRDITIDKKNGKRVIGVSLMHFEPLSVRRKYVCQTVTQVKQLPSEFNVEVRWCRYFEDEAFISGGVVH